MNFIGIDNGVTGSIGIIQQTSVSFSPMPVMKCLNYTKKLQTITRINAPRLYQILKSLGQSFCMIERPMVNPGRFLATASALRAYEATIIILEKLKIPYQSLDSKEWQRVMLPSGIWKRKVGKNNRVHLKADPEKLKFASKETAKRLFPAINLEAYNDADGLLIAEYCRRSQRLKKEGETLR